MHLIPYNCPMITVPCLVLHQYFHKVHRFQSLCLINKKRFLICRRNYERTVLLDSQIVLVLTSLLFAAVLQSLA